MDLIFFIIHIIQVLITNILLHILSINKEPQMHYFVEVVAEHSK
jgi:hypothetical protein